MICANKIIRSTSMIVLASPLFVCYLDFVRNSKAPKQSPRQKIIKAASRAFNRCGIDGIGIADIMKEAGLTQGAFSWHFDSKEELIREALEVSFHTSLLEDPVWKDRPLEEVFS
jgi:AcrR family transcriptional regulator